MCRRTPWSKHRTFQSSANAISYKVTGAIDVEGEATSEKFQSSANAISYKAFFAINQKGGIFVKFQSSANAISYKVPFKGLVSARKWQKFQSSANAISYKACPRNSRDERLLLVSILCECNKL